MVRLENNKIIIEIESVCPFDDFESLHSSLLECLSSISTDLVSQDNIRDAFLFLKAFRLTREQMEVLYGK